jgi:hypothetical protein
MKTQVKYVSLDNNSSGYQEGFTGSDSEINQIENNKSLANIGSIQSLEKKYSDLPLKEYCIKASHNSAVSGNYVNKNMLKHVLSRGCRFLDLEVFYIEHKKSFMPVVAKSSDPKFISFDTNNHITLEEAFSSIISNAFSGNSPNKGDPLFLHLRIKTKDTECYHDVAKLIDSILKPKLMEGQVNETTKMSEMMGKIVIVVDKTINRDYKDHAKCKAQDLQCYDLANYTNLESGGQVMNQFSLMQIENQVSSPILIKDDNVTTSATTSRLVLPLSKNSENPDMLKMILRYGIQIVGYKYDQQNEQLEKSEAFFNDNKGGIVPLAAAITYFDRVDQEAKK